MRPLGVVVAEKLGDLPAPAFEGAGYPVQALLLNGPIEPLQVPVVGGSPDPRVSVGKAAAHTLFGEPFGELRPMVRLE